MQFNVVITLFHRYNLCYQAGTLDTGDVIALAGTSRVDGSIVMAGKSHGIFATNLSTADGSSDFVAVAIDKNGEELWRWQVLQLALAHVGKG